MLAKRVCVRRDIGHVSATPSKLSDLHLISPSPRKSMAMKPTNVLLSQKRVGIAIDSENECTVMDIGWCHPAAQSSRRTDPNRRPTQNLVDKSDDAVPLTGQQSDTFMKRSAVTAMAYLGSSVVVSGGLDGGVFLARHVRSGLLSSLGRSSVAAGDNDIAIRGVHLDWGSSGSRYTVGSATSTIDGEYGVGAVTCLAATHSTLGGTTPKPGAKDVLDVPLAEEEILLAMEGCRVVAGTTCGDLRVWSVKDVFSAVFYSSRSTSDTDTSLNCEDSTHRGRGGGTDFAAGTSLTRLKFSLRGRALSGHRGGVSCIDVHSNVCRPDSIVSGGADGLIKLWSLRTPGTSGGRRSSIDPAIPSNSSQNRTAMGSVGGTKGGASTSSSGDALSILSGHGGRILCVKTAWHGDRLLSGGADRTVRL
jgi:WD domain, G-beta repeat